MLESNTDRMYFTIGAVIVAALIIGLAVWLFNSDGVVAQNITDTIYSMFESGEGAIEGIEPENGWTPPAGE